MKDRIIVICDHLTNKEHIALGLSGLEEFLNEQLTDRISIRQVPGDFILNHRFTFHPFEPKDYRDLLLLDYNHVIPKIIKTRSCQQVSEIADIPISLIQYLLATLAEFTVNGYNVKPETALSAVLKEVKGQIADPVVKPHSPIGETKEAIYEILLNLVEGKTSAPEDNPDYTLVKYKVVKAAYQIADTKHFTTVEEIAEFLKVPQVLIETAIFDNSTLIKGWSVRKSNDERPPPKHFFNIESFGQF